MDHNEQRDRPEEAFRTTELAAGDGEVEQAEPQLSEVARPTIEIPSFTEYPRLNAAIAGLVVNVTRFLGHLITRETV